MPLSLRNIEKGLSIYFAILAICWMSQALELSRANRGQDSDTCLTPRSCIHVDTAPLSLQGKTPDWSFDSGCFAYF